MSENSLGQRIAIFLVIIGILYVIGTIGEAGEPKCIKAGCNNKRASDSNYCYLHESSGSRYSSYGSSTYDSKYSDSSSAGNQESTNRSYSSDKKKNSSGKSTYDSYDDGYDDIYMDEFYLVHTYTAQSEDDAGIIPSTDRIYTPMWTLRRTVYDTIPYQVKNISSVFYNIRNSN